MERKNNAVEFDIDGEISRTDLHADDCCTVFGCKTGKCGCDNNIDEVFEQLMLENIQDEFALANDNERLLRVISQMEEQVRLLEALRATSKN